MQTVEKDRRIAAMQNACSTTIKQALERHIADLGEIRTVTQREGQSNTHVELVQADSFSLSRAPKRHQAYSGTLLLYQNSRQAEQELRRMRPSAVSLTFG
jgi:hypothetical protein